MSGDHSQNIGHQVDVVSNSDVFVWSAINTGERVVSLWSSLS